MLQIQVSIVRLRSCQCHYAVKYGHCNTTVNECAVVTPTVRECAVVTPTVNECAVVTPMVDARAVLVCVIYYGQNTAIFRGYLIHSFDKEGSTAVLYTVVWRKSVV